MLITSVLVPIICLEVFKENVEELLSASVFVLVLDESSTSLVEAGLLTPTQWLTEKR